jgi:hypothetical protein
MAELTPAQQIFMAALIDAAPYGAGVGNGRALRLDTARALHRKGLIVLTAYPSMLTGRLTYDYRAALA